jgi:hypothetical protein
MDPRIPRTQSQPNVNQAVCLEFLNWKVSTGSSRAHAHAHSRHSRSTLVGDPPTYQDSCSIPIHPSNDRSFIDIPHSILNPSIQLPIINRHSAFHALPCQYRIPAWPSRPSVVSKETRSVSVCAQPPHQARSGTGERATGIDRPPRCARHPGYLPIGRRLRASVRVRTSHRSRSIEANQRSAESTRYGGYRIVVTTNYPWSIDIRGGRTPATTVVGVRHCVAP